MRTVTAPAKAKAETQLATEPITIIKVEWADGTEYYGDEATTFGANPVTARILSFSPVLSSQQLGNVGSISTASVTLSDADLALKVKVDKGSIEGVPATVYHHYEDLTEADATVMLKGNIVASIEWTESTRQLSFTIETLDPNSENVGLADENCNVPVCFGTVVKEKACLLGNDDRDSIPQGVLLEEVDHSDFIYTTQISDDFPRGSFPDNLLELDIGGIRFTGYFTTGGSFLTVTAKNQNIYEDIPIAPRDAGSTHFTNKAAVWIDERINLEGLYVVKHFAGGLGRRANKCIKQMGDLCIFEYSWDSTLSAGTLQEAAAFPRLSWDAFETYYLANGLVTLEPDNWKLRPGAKITLISEAGDVATTGDTYIVNYHPSSTILGVCAYRSLNGIRILAKVPSSYYTIIPSYEITTGVFVTAIQFPVDNGLRQRDGENWEEDLYVTLTSSVAPDGNVADIIEWILTNFTDLSIDAASFASVQTAVANYPAGFCVDSTRDAITLSNAIAWQARCALTITNGTAFLNYLSKDQDGTFAAIDDNTEEDSVSLSFTQTGDIVTTFVAHWTPDGVTEEPKEIVYENNVDTYGSTRQEYDFFIYNIESLVALSANFWGYRFSNVWRKAQFTTFMNAIPADGRDYIEFGISTVGPNWITSTVEQYGYDSTDKRIEMNVELASKENLTGVPVEDPNYFVGDPANPILDPNPAPPPVVDGDSQDDYTVPLDVITEDGRSFTEDPGEERNVRYNFKVTMGTDRIVRGVGFPISISLVDKDGNVIGRDGRLNITLNSTDPDDVLDLVEVNMENGIYTGTLIITGGDDAENSQGVIRAGFKDIQKYSQKQYRYGNSEKFTILKTGTLPEWKVAPKLMKKGVNSPVKITGPNGTYNIQATDIPEKTKQLTVKDSADATVFEYKNGEANTGVDITIAGGVYEDKWKVEVSPDITDKTIIEDIKFGISEGTRVTPPAVPKNPITSEVGNVVVVPTDAYDYEGPFQVGVDPDNIDQGLLVGVLRDTDNLDEDDVIIIDDAKLVLEDPEGYNDVNLYDTMSGILYYELVVSSPTITPTLKFQFDPDALEDIVIPANTFVVPLAHVTRDITSTPETTVIYQLQRGNIVLGGSGGGDTLLRVTTKVNDNTQEYNCTVFGNGYSVASTGVGTVRFPRVATGIGITIVNGMNVAGRIHGEETYYTSMTPDVWQDGNDPF